MSLVHRNPSKTFPTQVKSMSLDFWNINYLYYTISQTDSQKEKEIIYLPQQIQLAPSQILRFAPKKEHDNRMFPKVDGHPERIFQ